MKKIIPFKKDIVFDTNIGEINSISLEHEITSVENNLVTGYFVVSGDYIITETSINVDSFEYKLPFDISIDEKYEIKDVNVDIDNFYYEVSNNKILVVNIELAVDNLEEKPKVREEAIEEIILSKEESVVSEDRKVEATCLKKEDSPEEEGQRCVEAETNLFSGSEAEGYRTYKVYMVRESDTIESIVESYGVTREEIEKYNDLSSVKLGDKLIIPSA